ncbi:hypothetical protein Q5530_28375 [Saccharothrix sp. BKS2]|uniref:hypothetical protein n=1 Tax=Saccharothrix sp. BKS2 TaxID=3064400 RepID=UPI0039EB058E
MSGAVAFVFGMCALSFAAGCVLTAVVLRREPLPGPGDEPVPPPVEEPVPAEVRWPSEDYVSKPIHRNPVMGFPVALPAPAPGPGAAPGSGSTRPALVLVPRPAPEGPVEPVRVRRMRVVPDLPEPSSQDAAWTERVGAELPGAEAVQATPGGPVVVEVPAHPEPVTGPGPPAPTTESSSTRPPPTRDDPRAGSDATGFPQHHPRTAEAARRKSST